MAFFSQKHRCVLCICCVVLLLSPLSRRHLSGRERGEEREREKEREALMQFLPKTFLHHGGRKRRKGGENNTEPLLWRKNASKNAFRFPTCTRKKSKLQLFRRRVICKFSLRQVRLSCADNGENVSLCSCGVSKEEKELSRAFDVIFCCGI